MSRQEIDAMQKYMLDGDRGYDDRWGKKPFSEEETDGWKVGWREADYESSGDENAEF